MKPLRVANGIVPIAQFKSEAPRWLRHVSESGEPVVITVNGKPAGVLVSPAEFDRLQERQRFMDSVEAGLADAEAGRTMTTAELRRRLAKRREQTKTR
jgi:antitoxin YefM